MPRRPGAPKLTHDGVRWRLRFTHEGVRHDFKNQVIPANDEARANRWMAGRLEWVYSGQWQDEVQLGSDPNAKLSEVAAAYLVEVSGGVITARTAELRKGHLRKHLLPRFKRLSDVTRGSLASYQADRLKVVTYATVKKELSTLAQVLKFAEVKGWLSSIPKFPRSPGKALGTKHAQGPSGFTDGFTALMARRLITELPTLSKRDRKTGEQWPIQAFFAMMHETTLRPGFFDGFRVGTHWSPGQSYLRITADVDKNRWARRLPLSLQGAAALEGIYASEVKRLGYLREGGKLFKHLDFRAALRRAASLAGLPTGIATKVHSYDIRHARITELVNTGRMLGAAYMAGHKQATTTNKYSHADEEQALELMGLVDDSGAGSGDTSRVHASGTCAASAKPLVFSCAKERTRTSTGVTPLAPQGCDNSGNRSVSRRLLCDTTRGDAPGFGHSGIFPQNDCAPEFHDPFQLATRPNLARAAYRLDVLCSELELGILESRVADVAAGGAS